MSRLIIGYSNQASAATLSGGAWASSRPLNNLKTRVLAQKARSTTTSATVAAAFVGQSVRVVALVTTNLTKNATYRIQCGAYDSGDVAISCPVDYPFSPDIVHCLPAAVTATGCTVTVTDSGNAAGYVEFGRLFIGAGFDAVTDQANGAEIGLESTTAISRAEYGELIIKSGVELRTANFSLVTTSQAGAEAALQLQRLCGLDAEVVYIHDIANADVSRRWLGTLSKLGAHQYGGARSHSVGFSIIEAG